jgi:hypothetical protein
VTLEKYISAICIPLAVLMGMLPRNLEMFNMHMHLVILGFTFNVSFCEVELQLCAKFSLTIRG